jgi:organizing structure protein 2
VLYPRSILHADTGSIPHKKPIYDDDVAILPPTSTPSSTAITTPATPAPRASIPKSSGPTPTDRLAVQIGKTRMFLYAHVAAAENKFNQWMDGALHLENSFTSTVASLAPPRETGEKLMPGAIYVLVAAMAGSIVTRNRNILLRGVVPLGVGIAAGWVVLPITMRNVGDLVWKYEQRFPVVADTHLRTKASIKHIWETGRAHSSMARYRVQEKLEEVRGSAEDWVRKGK